MLRQGFELHGVRVGERQCVQKPLVVSCATAKLFFSVKNAIPDSDECRDASFLKALPFICDGLLDVLDVLRHYRKLGAHDENSDLRFTRKMKIPEDTELSVWDFGSLARIRWFSAGLTARRCSGLGEDGSQESYDGKGAHGAQSVWCEPWDRQANGDGRALDGVADAVRELRDMGWSLRGIAKSVGVSTANVAWALRFAQ